MYVYVAYVGHNLERNGSPEIAYFRRYSIVCTETRDLIPWGMQGGGAHLQLVL
jgi:hypothetical protein